MAHKGSTAAADDESVLPPIPKDHGYQIGERIEMPLWGKDPIHGSIEWIDVIFQKKRFRGLAVLGDDGRYYEFHPEIAKRL